MLSISITSSLLFDDFTVGTSFKLSSSSLLTLLGSVSSWATFAKVGLELSDLAVCNPAEVARGKILGSLVINTRLFL